MVRAVEPPVRARAGYAVRDVVLLGVTAAVAVGLDQLTKNLAVQRLAEDDSVRLLGGAVYLVLTRNSGAAFSMGQNYTFVFPAIALGVLVWIVWMARRLRSVPWAIALGLVLGGALGNFLDRVFRAPGFFVGHVVDFISLLDQYGQGFPVFNVADMALFAGVALAVLLELTGRRRDGSREPGGRTRPPGDAGDGGTVRDSDRGAS